MVSSIITGADITKDETGILKMLGRQFLFNGGLAV